MGPHFSEMGPHFWEPMGSTGPQVPVPALLCKLIFTPHVKKMSKVCKVQAITWWSREDQKIKIHQYVQHDVQWRSISLVPYTIVQQFARFKCAWLSRKSSQPPCFAVKIYSPWYLVTIHHVTANCWFNLLYGSKETITIDIQSNPLISISVISTSR